MQQPAEPDAGTCPNGDHCTIDIFYHMIQAFTSAKCDKNGGAVNLKTLPDQTQTGEAVDAGYPSYVMVPQALTD